MGEGRMKPMVPLVVEIEQEEDGRWIADIPALPGVMVYGLTPADARARVQKLALLVLVDRLANED